MKRFDARWGPPAAWGSWLGVLTAIQLGFGYWGWESYTLLGASAFAMLAWGAWLGLAHEPRRDSFATSDLSWPTVFATAGGVTAFTGIVYGYWLALIGLGLLVVGLSGVARELVAQWSSER